MQVFEEKIKKIKKIWCIKNKHCTFASLLKKGMDW